MYDVVIVGCGIVGAAAAFELSKYRLKIGILERENDVATGTTKANSAILHAGYDPVPGTLMARLNVRGAALAAELCQKLDVPRRACGSLVLAFDAADMQTLQTLLARGRQNGVPDLRLLTGAEARALEPNLSDAVTGAQPFRCRVRRAVRARRGHLLPVGILPGSGRDGGAKRRRAAPGHRRHRL